ncbi:GntT/GntP/DsdX family permease, partial [Caballeronia sp. M23-90]
MRPWQAPAVQGVRRSRSHVNDGGFWLVKEYFGMTV